jgi:DNA polymerase-3 subunit gamma/tau
MGQVLYRKYRSRTFDEVVGQTHVTTTLKNALKNGQISHAYLFTGPRGVGKTSVARILAHEVNGLEYKDDSIHLDIIEIDGASNRRIDEIRELRERVHIAPTSAKYKVYIIDEVHMLTREAFNALLKTLEEPPAHCIFILATTEPHKLPDTIISRTQRFSFKPFERDEAVAHLRSIAKREKIDISPAALELLADHGEGSFRDSISMLDQLSSTKKLIDEQQILDMLGLPAAESIDRLLTDIKSGAPASVLSILEELQEQGVNAAAIAKQLAKSLRAEMLSGSIEAWIPALLKELLAVPASAEPADYLEICLLEAAGANSTASRRPVVTSAQPDSEPLIESVPTTKPIVVAEPPPIIQATKRASGTFELKDWAQIVEKAKSEAGSLYSALRLAKPEVSDSTLKLFFKFPLHQKKLTQAGNIDLLGKIIEDISGVKLKIESLVDKSMADADPPVVKKSRAPEPASATDNSLKSISNIFGSAEVLES